MASRRSGWFLHRLENYKIADLPKLASPNTTIKSYRCVSGLKNKISKTLILLNEYNRRITYKAKLVNNAVFYTGRNFFTDPIMPENFNQTLLQYVYLIKSLVARTYRARRMVRCKPAHGQRRWSNANTVKRCNLFLNTNVLAYKKDLYNMVQKTKFKWTKLHEMRQKAKLKKKTPKKKWTKFRKVGERRLQTKKQKKTPWQ